MGPPYIGGGILPESLDVEDARSAAERLLDPEGLNRAWEQGRAMSLEEAIGQAHQLGDLVSSISP